MPLVELEREFAGGPRSRIARRLLALLASSLWLGACSDGAVSADVFRSDYPSTYCGFLFRCCTGAERSYGSKSACEQAVAAEAKLATSGTFDGAGGESCLAALRGSCDPALAGGCLHRASAPHGSTGDSCSYATECRSYNCSQEKAGLPGICGSMAPKGSQCSGDDRGCESGSFCGTNRTCQTQKEPGLPCTRAGECVSGICSSATRTCAGTPSAPICDGA